MADHENESAAPTGRLATMATETMDELGRLWDAGIDSGPTVDGDEAFARIGRVIDLRPRDSEAR